MLIKYIQPNKDQSLIQLFNDTRSGASTAAFGVSQPLSYYLTANLDGKVLCLYKDQISARAAAEEISALAGEKAVFLPAKDDVLLYKRFFNKESVYSRIDAIYRIVNGARFITTTPEAILQLFPKRLEFLTIAVAAEYPLDSLIAKVVRMGYRRTEFAEQPGEFALRGDIFELYPVGGEVAYRCDFFGDEVERIRILDTDAHVGLEEVRSFKVLPAVDFIIEESEVNGLIDRLSKSFKKLKTLRQTSKARQNVDEIVGLLSSGNLCDPSLAYLYPLLSSSTGDLFSLLGDGEVTVCYTEPKLIEDNFKAILREHTERCLSLSDAGEALDFTMGQLTPYEEVIDRLSQRKGIAFQNINTTTAFFRPNKTARINCTPAPRYVSSPEDLPKDLFTWQKRGYRTVIATGTKERAARLKDTLYDSGILSTVTDTPYDTAGVYLVPTFINTGFILHDEKLVLIGTCDVFLSGVREKKLIKRRKDTFKAPEPGDFAVHETHGIGIVRGIERISTSDSTRDYVAIEYSGGDFLYVPVDQMDRLTKYLGGDKSPQLNKIGGAEFDRIKQRARESISRMTINLKKLYRDRAERKGFAFSPDNELNREFEDAFEFDLTEDQAQSVAEIKKDMESDKIMDRLLMGDVGFGKTEVALRAAFKAIMDGKQVAIMVPTTILSEQHFRTATQRFKDFGVKIALLNRFVSPAKIKQYLKGISEGTYSIIIGTHRLLGKDVSFKDLGLLILDEEQCFGVEAKEKLRTLKNNVDTLTMTATPIPRTLHMSLSGIRDMSLINTPPIKRIPVQTYVLEESDVLIRDAVLKELSRGGQAFILYNRVETINEFYGHIASLLPEARIVIGHGQMKKEALENNVMAFFNGEYDVLICTTIIENGIDLPNANTLIVIDADNFGLFTLYQLKGRVGRSDRMAHAYFTFKPNKMLSDVAYKRLTTLVEHSELGSGYKIAMRDLEIRGAGNVLGREQHGHMDKIGYELYSKLLKEQLGEVTKDYETELDVRVDAFIPNGYVSQSSSRMDAYKTIAEISSQEDKERVRHSIEELYGKLPREVENLLDVAEVKFLARSCEVISVTVTKDKALLILKDLNSLKDGGLGAALERFKASAVLSFGANPQITVTAGAGGAANNLHLCGEFLKFSVQNKEYL